MIFNIRVNLLKGISKANTEEFMRQRPYLGIQDLNDT